jgi:hypothetical protein
VTLLGTLAGLLLYGPFSTGGGVPGVV